jgi:hypothetical protein
MSANLRLLPQHASTIETKITSVRACTLGRISELTNRTTVAMDDVAHRLRRYFLAQLGMNTVFGVAWHVLSVVSALGTV